MKIFCRFLFDKDEFSTHRYVKQLKNGGVNFPGGKKAPKSWEGDCESLDHETIE